MIVASMITSVLIAPILIFGISIYCLIKDFGLIIDNNIEWKWDDNELELLNGVCAVFGSAASPAGTWWIHRVCLLGLPVSDVPMAFEIDKKVLDQDTKVILTCFVFYLGHRMVVS